MSDEMESPSSDEFWPPHQPTGDGADASYRAGFCLVVSRCPEKRHMLTRAASQAGWEAIVHADAAAAATTVHRRRFEMAWIDLESASERGPRTQASATGMDTSPDSNSQAEAQAANGHPGQDADWNDLCQAIAGLPSVLLAICGREFDPAQEIWARQLGVWLYIPGLSVDDAAEVAEVCEQALLVASGSHASL